MFCESTNCFRRCSTNETFETIARNADVSDDTSFFLFAHKTVQEGLQGLDIIKGCTHAPDSLGILEDQLFQNIYPASYLHKGYGFETVSYLAMVGGTLAMESISLAEVIRLPPPSRFSLQPTPDTNCGFNFRKRDNAERYR